MTHPPYITAAQFKTLCENLFGAADARARAQSLDVAPATYYSYLKHGVTTRTAAARLTDLAGQTAATLRARARALDRFTTR